MVKKIFTYSLFLSLIIILFTTFFAVRIRILEKNISSINTEISNNYEDLQNYKAEWNYLNNSEYLEDMVNKYLKNYILNSNDFNNDLIDKIPFIKTK